MKYPFNWSILLQSSVILALLSGLLVTLELAAIGIVISFIIGVPIGLMRLSSNRAIHFIASSYVNFIRTTPPLVQVLFWYFGASFIFPRGILNWLVDHNLSFTTTTIALGIYTSAFMAEIFRAGIQAVPKGQFEAAYSSGLSYFQVMCYVVMPQVIRITAPPIINEILSLTKNTSLGLAVGVDELTFQGKLLQDYSFQIVEAYTAVTLLYLGLSLSGGILYNVATRRFQLKH